MKIKYLLPIILILGLFSSCTNEKTWPALIITGQNNHNWQASSPILKQILDNTGLFSCEIMTTPAKGGDMNTFNPDFSKYRLVVVDYAGDPWSETVKKSFTEFVNNGGGVVIYHFSCAAFPEWKEYNEMTGLGGWGGRNEKDGPYMYYKQNNLVIDTASGPAGSHGQSREFVVRTRKPDHPVMKGLPTRWLHGKDELYSQLRGPAKNIEILATAFADTVPGGGTMRDEPVLMTNTYGKGRIFITVMGHADEGGGSAIGCSGFIVTLQRGAEWAVTGNVTQTVPFDFPSIAGVVLRTDYKELTPEEAFKNIGSYDISKSTKSLTCLQNYMRSVSNNPQELLKVEQKLNNILKSSESTIDAKKLILRELSWMGTEYSIKAITDASLNEDLKDEASFALERLGNK
jgi:type 1 glutamine amidotransferase